MQTPPIHGEVERLGLEDVVEKARVLMSDREWLLHATEDLIAMRQKLNDEQTQFLLAWGLDAVIRALDEENLEFNN